MGHWCEFCQMEHSSASCYHPANKPASMEAARDWSMTEIKSTDLAQLRTDLHDAVGLMKALKPVGDGITDDTAILKCKQFLNRPSVKAAMETKP